MKKWLRKEDKYHNTYFENFLFVVITVVVVWGAFMYSTKATTYYAGNSNYDELIENHK